MGGYQIELTPQGDTATAALYEEGDGRGFLAQQGQIVRRLNNNGSQLLGTINDSIPTILKGVGEWNSFHVIARGSQIIIIVNGHMSAMVIDEDYSNRATEGLLGMQMHVGGPFEINFRNIYYKQL